MTFVYPTIEFPVMLRITYAVRRMAETFGMSTSRVRDDVLASRAYFVGQVVASQMPGRKPDEEMLGILALGQKMAPCEMDELLRRVAEFIKSGKREYELGKMLHGIHPAYPA